MLAAIGSTAPFVGLLGTVWSIMSSFISIVSADTKLTYPSKVKLPTWANIATI